MYALMTLVKDIRYSTLLICLEWESLEDGSLLNLRKMAKHT